MFYAGAVYNFPELNCCACGKQKYEYQPDTLPSTAGSVCTHYPKNN